MWGEQTEKKRVGLAQWLACPPLTQLVLSSPPDRVIPKTYIKIVQTASLNGTQWIRVGSWQCSLAVQKAG